MPLLSNNSIAWANHQISGGWMRTAWVMASVAVGLPLVMFGTTRMGTDPNSALSGWFVALSILQAILFGIVIPSRVHGAIKRDRLNKLIESHRLMPESPAAAIVGYILGPNLLLLCCMGVVMIIGAFIAGAAQQDPRGWLGLHVAAAGLSLMMCCLVAFTSQFSTKVNPALFGFIFGPIAMNAGFIVPALRVMFSPYSPSNVGFASLQKGDIRSIHVVAFASQLVFAFVLFIGACRRYRRDDVPPLGYGWGMVLLAMWVFLTCVGLMSERIWMLGVGSSDRVKGMSYVVGLSTSLIIAIAPIASAAIAVAKWRDRHAIDAYHVDRKPMPLYLAAFLVLGVLLTLLSASPENVGVLIGFQSTPVYREPIHLALTAVVIGLFVLSIAMLSHAGGRIKVPPYWLILPWLGLTWILIPTIDLVSAALQDQLEFFPRALSSASPPMCLGLIWKNELNLALTGIVAQLAAIFLLLAMWSGVKRINRKQGRDLAATVAA